MTRIYIAGPITGYPNLNREVFASAAESLRAQGHDPVNPHDLAPHPHDGECPDSYAVAEPGGHGAACYLRPCFVALLGCEEVRLLPGWESSKGACRERAVAVWAGIPVSLFDDPKVEVGLPRGCGCRHCATSAGSCARCGQRDPREGRQLCDPCWAELDGAHAAGRGVG